MDNYWKKGSESRVSRRRLLAGAGTVGAGAAGLALVGCGDDDSTTKTAAAGTTTAAGGSATAGASASAAAPQVTRGGTLKRTTWLNVLGIDPHIEVSVGLFMASGIYNYLHVINSADQKFQPVFAESVEQPSPTEFIFKLRKGAKMQNVAPVNGREITSEDVKTGWNF